MGLFCGRGGRWLLALAAVRCADEQPHNVEKVFRARLAVVPGTDTGLTAEFRMKTRVVDGTISLLENDAAQTEDWAFLRRFASGISTDGPATLAPINKRVPMHEGRYYCMRLVAQDVEDFTRVQRLTNGLLVDVRDLRKERAGPGHSLGAENAWTVCLVLLALAGMVCVFCPLARRAYVFCRKQRPRGAARDPPAGIGDPR